MMLMPPMPMETIEGSVLPSLTYHRSVRGWRGMIDGTCEVIVAGNREQPSPFRLPLAEEVVANISDVVRVATAYLDSFVSRDRFDLGAWGLAGIDVGCTPRLSAGDSFELTLVAENDQYGRWSVGLAPSADARPARFVPFWFGRKQI